VSFLGGIFGGGGSSNTTVTNVSQNTVNVDVTPQIGVSVDLAPIEAFADKIAAAGTEQADALAGAIRAEGTALQNQATAFQSLSDTIGKNLRTLALIAGGSVLLFFFGRKAH
jgi:hypothetical protein